jgi:uncharacterized protein (UPF0332 family)
MLEQEQRKSIITYRIEKAYKNLEEAKAVAQLAYWNLTGNRLYYSLFHMASALLLDKGFSPKTHAGVIHLIGEKFIATGMLKRDYGRLFSRLYELRQSGDYDEMYDATEEEVMPYFNVVECALHDFEALIDCK